MGQNTIKKENTLGQGTTKKGEFATLLQQSDFSNLNRLQGIIKTGRVVRIENDIVWVDVGLKSEGRIALKEFEGDSDLQAGSLIEVYVERMENKAGEAVLSREKVKQEAIWAKLETIHREKITLLGMITGRVKGGFTVRLQDTEVMAFLPGSQVDVRVVRDMTPLMTVPQRFLILKIDRLRGNVVVSRRMLYTGAQQDDFVNSLSEGQTLQGVVKNLQDYGAFVDLGGVDGLIHITDISWRRISHPSEVIQIGQAVTVKILRLDKETPRLSIGMKQLESDPWEGIETKYPVESKTTGRVTNITDYGAFVEIEPGIEGLIHISEMDWGKMKSVHPQRIVSTLQEVEVMIIDIDQPKRRLSLSLKRCRTNPWEEFLQKYPPMSSVVDGVVKNVTEYGLFVGLPDNMDGLVYVTDIDWDKTSEEALRLYKREQRVRVQIREVDVERERIRLSIKHLRRDPFEVLIQSFRKGDIVPCRVTDTYSTGISVVVELKVGVQGGQEGEEEESSYATVIRKPELALERTEQRPENFTIGQQVEAKLTYIDKANRKISLSIKAREQAEERQALSEYGSSLVSRESTATTLGDLVTSALLQAKKKPKKTKTKKKKVSDTVEERTLDTAAGDEVLDTSTEEKELATAVEEKELATAVEEKELATAVEEKELATAVEEKELATAVEEKALDTAVEEKELATAVEEKELATAVEEKALDTAVEEKELATAVEEKELATVVEEKELATAVEEKELATAVEEKESDTAVEEKELATAAEEKELATGVEGKELDTAKEDKVSDTVEESGNREKQAKSQNEK